MTHPSRLQPVIDVCIRTAAVKHPSCAENGVAAPVVGIIGTIQALEAMKLLAGFGTSLAGYLLVFDAKQMEWRKLRLPKNPDCSACGGPS